MEDSTKVKVEVEVEVPSEWIELLTKYSDMFMTSYCGYWMTGIKRDDELGWLAYEHEDDDEFFSSKDPEYRAIVKAWREGNKLPDRWFRLDKSAAIRAYVEGCKRYGANWYEKVGDAITYDVVIQMALLGEVRYG